MIFGVTTYIFENGIKLQQCDMYINNFSIKLSIINSGEIKLCSIIYKNINANAYSTIIPSIAPASKFEITNESEIVLKVYIIIGIITIFADIVTLIDSLM